LPKFEQNQLGCFIDISSNLFDAKFYKLKYKFLVIIYRGTNRGSSKNLTPSARPKKILGAHGTHFQFAAGTTSTNRMSASTSIFTQLISDEMLLSLWEHVPQNLK
jgi:hypothetical protein